MIFAFEIKIWIRPIYKPNLPRNDETILDQCLLTPNIYI